MVRLAVSHCEHLCCSTFAPEPAKVCQLLTAGGHTYFLAVYLATQATFVLKRRDFPPPRLSYQRKMLCYVSVSVWRLVSQPDDYVSDQAHRFALEDAAVRKVVFGCQSLVASPLYRRSSFIFSGSSAPSGRNGTLLISKSLSLTSVKGHYLVNPILLTPSPPGEVSN